ncbi:PQQ-dependent sugar dehydrogenase [Sorangium sp. So ce854]|uniref:PQQ-dependent sugar dehydrogenase n=1 Tax=Sorangium sp. So ce854 TaxID=3133322 RepID=UPI003F5DA07B
MSHTGADEAGEHGQHARHRERAAPPAQPGLGLRALRRSLGAAAAVAAALSPGCTCGAPAPPPPSQDAASAATLAVFARGLDAPVALTFAPGDPRERLFVVEKTGRIRILVEGRAQGAPFLDVSALVSTGDEQGLLGLAFHPRYAEDGRFFVNYTDRRGDTRVVEYRAAQGNPDRADPATARELLHIEQPYSNHNGGHLAFGPDGKLYVGTGDGGKRDDPHGHGQDRRSLLGKMLALDVSGAGQGRPAPEIVQIGLRNPWRYSFDRKTGDLYIADVGQDRHEEVHVVPVDRIAGHNFGWNVVEGDGHCLRGLSCNRDGLTPPVMEYPHNDGCSITGGFVYRGAELPELDGLYFYADYCTALLRSFRWKDGRATEPTDWKPILDPDNALSRVTSFGEDARGELYVLSQDGEIYRFARRR